jgi:divalent metal cation (Fe/Co/Zn/Cd) transporter
VDEAGKQTAITIVIILAVIAAVLVPSMTLWRLRTPARRRDEWLGANAQPRMTMVAHGIAALLGVTAALACGMGAIGGYPILWAPAALGGGVLASAIISGTVALRTPAEIEEPDDL